MGQRAAARPGLLLGPLEADRDSAQVAPVYRRAQESEYQELLVGHDAGAGIDWFA